MVSLSRVQKILKKNRSKLLRKGIEAVGIGYKVKYGKQLCELAMVCSVKRKFPLSEISRTKRIPTKISGVLTDVIQTGTIRALRTERHRPAPGGVSIGHVDITAGTLGCFVKRAGNIYILSNNHVLACSNEADIGDPIVQPGVHDSGEYPCDHIADLFEFVPINFGGLPSECHIGGLFTGIINRGLSFFGRNTRLKPIRQTEGNLVDAAIARPLQDDLVANTILGIGRVEGIKRATLGMQIQKSGRTTGITVGKITQVDVSVNVQYGAGKIAQFDDQIMAGPMSAGGDSGSVVLSNDNCLCGLLFAGSEEVTIMNRIEHVFHLLQVTL